MAQGGGGAGQPISDSSGDLVDVTTAIIHRRPGAAGTGYRLEEGGEQGPGRGCSGSRAMSNENLPIGTGISRFDDSRSRLGHTRIVTRLRASGRGPSLKGCVHGPDGYSDLPRIPRRRFSGMFPRSPVPSRSISVVAASECVCAARFAASRFGRNACRPQSRRRSSTAADT